MILEPWNTILMNAFVFMACFMFAVGIIAASGGPLTFPKKKRKRNR